MATSRKDTGYVDNWQAGKTVSECNLHMLTTEDCSDVIFRVGSEKHVVRAHRYVLVSRSCVFHAMFCGPLAEKGEVTIPDVTMQVFSDFLRYLYAGDVNITPENVTGLLYTSRKYAVDGLLNQCSKFLEKYLTEDNVCHILEQCHSFGELDLEQKALKIITEAGEKVIKSPYFQELCSSCFEKMLKSEKLALTEEKVFEAALSWAEKNCNKEKGSSSPEDVREYLGEMIYDIRFTELPLEYLAKVVRTSKLLRESERLSIMDKILDTNIDISPFKSGPRRRRTCLVNIFERQASTSLGLACEGKDAIKLSVTKDITLLGCKLYGSLHKQESTYLLNIVLYDNQDSVVAHPVQNYITILQGQRKLNDIMFASPVSFKANRVYTICLNRDGENTMFGVSRRTSGVVDGVQFTFLESKRCTIGTDRGQISALIFSY